VYYHRLENKIFHFSQETLGLDAASPLLLAVSGGIDSMVMLHLFHYFSFNIQVAHCNFGLRGAESDKDEILCMQVCKKFEIPFFSKTFDTTTYANENGLSIQMAARKLRYDWFKELMSSHAISRLATAHHREDQTETILLHLINGRSVRSLGGIPLKNGNIIRPLLCTSKREIKEYAEACNIIWREDASNANTDYDRNFIRHEIIPQIEKINPSIHYTLESMGKRIGDVNYLAEQSALDVIQRNKEVKSDHTIIHFNEILANPSKNFIMWMALKTYGFQEQIILNIIDAHPNSGREFYSNEYLLRVDRSTYIIEKIKAETVFKIDIESKDESIYLPFGFLEFSIYNYGQSELNFTYESVAYIDADKLKFPLQVRSWQEGDYFYPLGMNHRKKLSDFFIDEKIPVHQKKKQQILTSGDDIVWVLGKRLDHRYRITEATNKIFEIDWKYYDI